MGSAGTTTWLQKLDEERALPLSLVRDEQTINRFAVNVDVDWMDPAFTKSLPIVPHDMTSNQLWVDIQMDHPDNNQLFKTAIREYKDKGWLRTYTRIVCFPTRRTSRYGK